MRGIGVAASALAGGAQGAGGAMAKSSEMDYTAELQRTRDEFMSQKAERLQALQQQFQGTENALQRGSTEDIATRGNAVALAGQASTAQTARETTASHERISANTIASHERTSKEGHEIARLAANKVQVDGDGNVNVLASDGSGGFKAIPVMAEDGTVFKGPKDMTQKDQNSVKALQALIKDDTDLRAKSYDPKQQQQIDARIARYVKKIGTILGMEEIAAPAAPAPGGARKPLTAFME